MPNKLLLRYATRKVLNQHDDSYKVNTINYVKRKKCRKYEDEIGDVKSFTISINHADYKSGFTTNR